MSLNTQDVIDLALELNLPPNEYFVFWEDMAKWTRSVLESLGGISNKNILDVGCGAIRCAAQFLSELDNGHYVGVDPFEDYITLGTLIGARLKASDKITLICSDSFEFPADRKYDFAIAQSVFTHLPEPKIKECLQKVKEVMKTGGKFLFTYCTTSPSASRHRYYGFLYAQRMPVILSHLKDETLFREFASDNNFTFSEFTEIPHPTGQKVCILTF